MPPSAITIVIPIYDVEPYLAECIESVLAQDIKDFQVVCVNDCSTDRSREIAAMYAAQDTRIELIDHSVNEGLGVSRNTGSAAANGEYLFFLDSDDRLSSEHALRRLLRAAVSEGSEMTAGSAASLEPSGVLTDWDRRFERSYTGRVLPSLSGRAGYNALIRRPGANYLPLRSWGWLIDHAFYKECALDHPVGVHEDLGHNALLAARAHKIRYCSDVVVDYRQRSGSISKSPWSSATVDSYLNVWHHFRDNHARFGVSDMKGNAALHVVRNLFWMLQRNGIMDGDEDHIVAQARNLMAEVQPGTDSEMIDSVLRIINDVADESWFPPGRLADFIQAMPIQSMMAGAYYTIGMRHS